MDDFFRHGQLFQNHGASGSNQRISGDSSNLTGTQQEVIYETLDPSGLWPVYWEKLKAAGQWAPAINYPGRFYRYSSKWVYGGSISGSHSPSTPCKF